MSGSLDDIRAHRQRATYNAALADQHDVALPRSPEWAIVIRFYAALHLVQSYLGTKNTRFRASLHEQRWKAIKASPELTKGGKFTTAYRSLQDVSEQVRYDPGFTPTPRDVTDAKSHLRVVESFVSAKIDVYLKSQTI